MNRFPPLIIFFFPYLLFAQTDTPQAILGRHACTNGAILNYPCSETTLLAFLPILDMGGNETEELADIWGWQDPETGKEYALVARESGVSFVNITNPENPIYVGQLPTHLNSKPSYWRDVKVYRNYAYIVADKALNHGMQVFHLTKLREYTEAPIIFEETAHYPNFANAHNIFINEDTGYAYVVGANRSGETCGGGLHIINIQNPTAPEFVNCFSDTNTGSLGTGYTHDVQCVVYHGPDARYSGNEICFGANETALSIADVTDKNNPVALSIGSYPNSAYAHQGWLSEDHKYFFMGDELDEYNFGSQTRTLVWDVANLEDPILVKEYIAPYNSQDHNMYIRKNYLFQANYSAGVRILDIATPEDPKEIAFLDIYPPHDGISFEWPGAWSVYPYFESNVLIASGIKDGLYIFEAPNIDLSTTDKEITSIPKGYRLEKNYPNPFSTSTRFVYEMPTTETLTLTLYDVMGRAVKQLWTGVKPQGIHSFTLDSTHLAAGTYIFTLQTPTAILHQTVQLIK